MVEDSLADILAKAESKANTGEYLIAAELYRKATELAPEDASAWYGYGVVQAKRGNHALAVDAFQRSHNLNPEHAPTTANLALLIEETDSRRASELARLAIVTMGEIPELVRISELHPLESLPLIDSSHVYQQKQEEIPSIESRLVKEEPELILGARPLEMDDVSEKEATVLTVEELIIAASELYQQRLYQELLELIKSRLEGDAVENPILWRLCGFSLWELGMKEEGKNALEFAVTLGSDSPDVQYTIAQFHKENSDSDSMKDCLSNCLLQDPNYIEALLLLGETRFEEGDLEGALELFSNIIETDPFNPIQERIGEIRNLLNPPLLQSTIAEPIVEEELVPIEQTSDENESEAEAVIEQPPEHERENEEDLLHEEADESVLETEFVNTKVARMARAKKHTSEGDYAASVKEWKELLQTDSSDSEIWRGLAEALSLAGHVDRANQCLLRADELDEIRTQEEVTDFQNEQDLVIAAKEAQERVEKSPVVEEDSVNEIIEWYNKGLTLLAENNPLQALNCFEKAISGAPREERELRVRSQNGKGHALYQLERFPESIQAYHAAITMDPQSVTGRTLYNMGSAYAAIELFEDAIKCFQQAKERGLVGEEAKLCSTQINRCKLLKKEQDKRLSIGN